MPTVHWGPGVFWKEIFLWQKWVKYINGHKAWWKIRSGPRPVLIGSPEPVVSRFCFSFLGLHVGNVGEMA